MKLLELAKIVNLLSSTGQSWFLSVNDTNFFTTDIDKLIHRWDKCINKYGDFLEK